MPNVYKNRHKSSSNTDIPRCTSVAARDALTLLGSGSNSLMLPLRHSITPEANVEKSFFVISLNLSAAFSFAACSIRFDRLAKDLTAVRTDRQRERRRHQTRRETIATAQYHRSRTCAIGCRRRRRRSGFTAVVFPWVSFIVHRFLYHSTALPTPKLMMWADGLPIPVDDERSGMSGWVERFPP